MLAPSEREPDLPREPCTERHPRENGHRLRLPLARDDVRLPLVREDPSAALSLENCETAEMRAMSVRDRDPLQVGGRATEPADLGQDGAGVGPIQGVDQRQLAPVLDEERTDVTSALAADDVDARGEFHRRSVAG